jgi:ATP-binding cassette subfamily C protein
VGTVFAEGLLFALVIGSFFLVDPASAVGAIVYFGLIAIVIQYFIGRLMQKAGRQNADATVEANSIIGDLGEVLREASVLDKKDFFFNKIYEARMKAASSFASQFVLSGMPRYIVETALIIAVALFVLVQALSGDLVTAAGTVGVFLSGGLRLTASLLPMQNALLTIKQAIPQAEKSLELLETSKKSVDLENVRHTEPVKGFEAVEVSMRNVGFSYPDSASVTLHGINVTIPAGQQAAFIGPSGAGKSTLADLVLGLLEPAAGDVSVGGMTAKDIVLAYPGRLAYVPQKPGMIAGTIAENIALGVPRQDVDQFRLQKSISDSQLTALIESLPEGLNTDLGKRRDELSGGQLQRIGLARALYAQPGLLVMDEATSALDANAENEINRALDEMRGKVTVILIAHRLNTVQRSDVVFLLEQGQITASGTFAELLKENETVQKLAELMSIESAD